MNGLLAAGVIAARGRRIRRQTGILDPGIPSDCSYWDIVARKSQDCDYFEELYGLEHEQFVEYVSVLVKIMLHTLTRNRILL
jgi:hypothetical protein